MRCSPEVLDILCSSKVEAIKKLGAVNNITDAVEPCQVFCFNIN